MDHHQVDQQSDYLTVRDLKRCKKVNILLYYTVPRLEAMCPERNCK